MRAVQEGARAAGPYAAPVAAGGAALVVAGAGGVYAIQWALEDPLPEIPPLHPDLAPGDGNISITIPVPGSTTVTSGVGLFPGLETADPGFTAVSQPGLNIVEANSGTSGGERAGKAFTKKGKETVINANKQENDGVMICAICGTETVPAQQGRKGVSPAPNETHVDHIFPRSLGGDGSPSNGQVLCRTCNLRKSDNLQ
jgi:hypothetical protein